jgi:hypothetical protein
MPQEIFTDGTQKWLKSNCKCPRQGQGWRDGEGLANEQSDMAEKKDAMGEIHRLCPKVAAINSQTPREKVWGWIMENDLRVRASTRRGKKSG